jgi:hypothetical protein
MSNARAETRWLTFRSQPASFAHPRRIVHAFDGGIGDDVALALADDERFRNRLSALLTERYGLTEDVGEFPSAALERLVLASSSELTKLVRQCGAVYWARAIVGTIDSKAVVALKQRLGDDTYAAALTHRDLAAVDQAHPTNDELDDAITAAGLRCLGAWCARAPAGIAQRIRLKLADRDELDGPPLPPFDALGPRIVDRVMTQESVDA